MPFLCHRLISVLKVTKPGSSKWKYTILTIESWLFHCTGKWNTTHPNKHNTLQSPVQLSEILCRQWPESQCNVHQTFTCLLVFLQWPVHLRTFSFTHYKCTHCYCYMPYNNAKSITDSKHLITSDRYSFNGLFSRTTWISQHQKG